MNLIIKRYKILIISFSMFFLFFNCFKPQRVNAVVGVDDALVVGGITVSGAALLDLVGCALVVGGGTYVVSNWNNDCSNYVADKMVSTGTYLKDLSVKVTDTGQKVLTFTQTGLNNVWDYITSYTNEHPIGGITYDGSSITVSGTPTYTEIYHVVRTGSVSATFPVNLGVVVQNGVKRDYTRCFWNICSVGIALCSPSGSVLARTEVKDGTGSVCVDGITSRTSDDGMSVDNYNDNVGNVGVPLSGDSVGGSTVYEPSIDFPVKDTGYDVPKDFPYYYPDGVLTDSPIDAPLDSPVDVPAESDTTGDVVADGDNWVLNIPILGDILKVLLKILELLKTFIKTLIDALVSAITTLFVPSDTYFTDKFDGYRTTLISKFGDNNFDFLQQSGANIEDIYINIFGQHVCIVKITLFNKFKDFAFIVIRAFFYFFLILFNFNQIIKFLRGSIFSDYNSREAIALVQNNDNKIRITGKGGEP